MKYAAFDVGNVLLNVDFPNFINKLSRTLNITVEDATYFLNRSHSLHDIGLTVMRDELIDHLHIKSSVLRDELIKDWNNSITPAHWILGKIDKLTQEHDIRIAFLSNVGLEHAIRMRDTLGHYSFFTKGVTHFSCEVGARKPTYLYYQSFLQLHPEFQGCPYFDDLQENLNTGAKFGFKPFKFALDEIGGRNVNDKPFDFAKVGQFEDFLIKDHVVA